jgi:transaldolase
MKFFLDTAEISEIREAEAMGILDGVTTNPSLVAKAAKPFKQTMIDICNAVKGPTSIEVTALKYDEMLDQAHEYAKWSEYGVIKLPTTRDGVKACKTLAGEGIKVNMTLCFSASQALLVAKAGATYCSPFLGRVDDISWDGMQLIKDIRLIYDNYGFKTNILAASLRHPMHVVECAKAGADVGTMPFKVLEMLFNHPLTDKGLAQFLKDWEKAVKS